MKLVEKTRNKIRCPVCDRFIDSGSLNWNCRSKPGDETNSLNNFLWCCKECIVETTYWELYEKDYRIVAYAYANKESPSIMITLRPYYDRLMRVRSTI